VQVGSLGRTDKLLEGCPIEYDSNQEMEMKRLNMVPQVAEPVRADHEEKMQVVLQKGHLGMMVLSIEQQAQVEV